MLLALTPTPGSATASRSSHVERCKYCDGDTGPWSCDHACGLCHVALNLGRPRINDEAVLCWLPEISQAVVSRIVREMHRRLATSSRLAPDAAPAHYVGGMLTERVDRADELLGTVRPSDLAQALTLLSPSSFAARHRLVGGIRILPTGSLFVNDNDIFSDLVAHWSTV